MEREVILKAKVFILDTNYQLCSPMCEWRRTRTKTIISCNLFWKDLAIVTDGKYKFSERTRECIAAEENLSCLESIVCEGEN